MDVQIHIGKIKIGSMENCAALNIGKNYLKNFDSVSKTNQGLGNVYGNKNNFPTNTNYVEDPDLIDILKEESKKPSHF